MSNLDKILQEKQCVLELVEGIDELDNPLFAYVLLKKNNQKRFLDATKKGNIDLAKFGVVVAHGNGSPIPGFEQLVLDAILKV